MTAWNIDKMLRNKDLVMSLATSMLLSADENPGHKHNLVVVCFLALGAGEL